MPRINEANLEEHRRHTMNALLDSAEKIMREQGGEALTPANVSKGAGIARNSIYRYVKDMKDLRRQLMARHMPQWVEALEKGLSGVIDPAEIIVQWVKINLEQSILQGHDWMTQIPLSDAQSYRDDKGLWPKPGNGVDGNNKDGNSSNNKGGNDTATSQERNGKAESQAKPDRTQSAEKYKADSGNASRCPIDEPENVSRCPIDAPSNVSKCPIDVPTSLQGEGNAQTPSDQPLEPTQPSLHERINAPIVRAWGQLSPQNPQVGIAVTEGLVSSGMKLLSGKEQTEELRASEISDIERAIRAIVKELREDQ
ncbi:TetR/AcrR family transcriptional regulator [Bifidobacterium sp. ESL0690]|uniref:TetR/AcrR family transcriptional regulator n=1 Tax=Bifidobacterium sp. ESL0690 TaxID=2983214 RepID=UPI0023F99402|nr:TetR/AcrR family transcriptional regulator [Bifidobacterium sp. ESL0690]WEV46866.1 TetR/AcrR family transcriptional regulator [Bifidobacterium sp. ESL0690]